MRRFFTTEYQQILADLAASPRLLIIQDLDGVCMSLKRNPQNRELDYSYLQAARKLHGEFYVLTNGEHIGRCGVNTLVEQSCGDNAPLYLPGLAAGGVQLQDINGQVSHPEVSGDELKFLERLITNAQRWLHPKLEELGINADEAARLAAICVLDNHVSPSFNISSLHPLLTQERFSQLQQDCYQWLRDQLDNARRQGLEDSFFIHLAPNQGADANGEQLMPPSETRSGTTDLQFMLKGAVKETGVLVLLNHYYHGITGEYPLDEDFNARTAPADHAELLKLAQARLAPELMPQILAVGDTLTSMLDHTGNRQRGGSDRGFLTLVQDLGQLFGSDNIVAVVDSSQGEIDRPSIQREYLPAHPDKALAGLSDADDPLKPNLLFCDGPQQYRRFLMELANIRRPNSHD